MSLCWFSLPAAGKSSTAVWARSAHAAKQLLRCKLVGRECSQRASNWECFERFWPKIGVFRIWRGRWFLVVIYISCTIIVNFLRLISAALLITRSHFGLRLSCFLVAAVSVVTRMSPLGSHLTVITLSLMKLFFILLDARAALARGTWMKFEMIEMRIC